MKVRNFAPALVAALALSLTLGGASAVFAADKPAAKASAVKADSKTDAKKADEKPAAKDAPKKAAPKKEAAPKKDEAKKADAPAKKTAAKKGVTGKADDLTKLNGVGPAYAKKLNAAGVTTFEQVAAWKKADIEKLDEQISGLQAKAENEGWVAQAKDLAKEN